jgi:ABC-type transport system involved in multi-copper enzyme maturation permease subunit
MLPGPVFYLELRRLSRRKRYYALLTLYGLLLLYVVWSSNPQSGFVVNRAPAGGLTIDQWHYAGKSLFQDYALWQTAMVVLLTPAMVAGVIAEERERKTMASLLVSRLTSAEIVLGKLCARLLHLACFVALGLPVLVLVEHFGGVGLKGALIYFAATATTAFFVGAVSILFSTQARRSRDAVVCVYLLDFVWVIVPALMLFLFSSDPNAPLRMAFGWVGSTCPFFVMFETTRGTRFWESPNVDNSIRMMAIQLALGVVMTTVAVRRLRPAFRKDKPMLTNAGARDEPRAKGTVSPSTPSETEPQPDRSWLRATCDDEAAPAVEVAPTESRQAQQERQPRRVRLRPKCGDDAMLWKEVWATSASLMTRVIRGLVLATMLTVAAVFCFSDALASAQEVLEHGYDAEFETSYHRLDLSVTLRHLVTITAGLMLLWVSIVAASSLAGERDKHTWVSLVSTPLSGFEIIRGKVIGAFWSVRALVALWLSLVMMGLFVGAVHPLGVLAVTLATAIYLVFGCVLGMAYSLRARSASRAVVSTLITLIILNGAYLVVFVPLNVRSALTAVGVTPFVEQSVLMNYLNVKWLLDFESPDQSMLEIGLTCALSVALYACATFALALWTLKSFDRVIDRPRSMRALARPAREVKRTAR